MDRRDFIESCSAGAACMTALSAFPALAADAKPHSYARVLLVDEFGTALKAGSLKPQTNYVFHYPFEATPVFLLDLGKPALPKSLAQQDKQVYAWPGGVGPQRNLVAYSAICAHKLVYPTQQLRFISFRKGPVANQATPSAGDNLIHCCADHSQYDPAKGAQVLSGPATQPLCAVLLEHDARADTLTAYATLGGELFDDFFRKYEMKLSLDVGPRARHAVQSRSVVRELEKFCKNPVRC